MTDIAIMTKATGIFSQAFYKHQLLIIHDDEIPAPDARPFTVGEASGLGGKYIITDWVSGDGSDVFTADIVEGGRVIHRRPSILPWWWVALVVGLVAVAVGIAFARRRAKA